MTAAPSRTCVVILNGIGSVGKSSVARALQSIAARPFLHIAMDTFIEMMPAALLDHPDGLLFESGQDGGKPVVAIRSGPVLQRTMRGMRHAIAAMAAEGNDLIVDEVMIDVQSAQTYRDLLRCCDLHMVGLFAPLDVLEERERARGDRMIGLARWQYDRVHRGMAYDLEVDTTRMAPEDCARLIRDRFAL